MPNYPRPQFVRDSWQSLDGLWRYAFDEAEQPSEVTWQGDICVPYPPEAPLSGVHDEGFHPVVWYERTFSVPEAWRGKRVHLHFGAVDYSAKVWVNGRFVVAHEGGHTPFAADITTVLGAGELGDGEATVTVRAADDPLDLHKPRGKQDWQQEPHNIWYPRTTGIWQSVWLEPVPARAVAGVRFTPDLARFAIETEATLAGDCAGCTLSVRFTLGDVVLAEDDWSIPATTQTAATPTFGTPAFAIPTPNTPTLDTPPAVTSTSAKRTSSALTLGSSAPDKLTRTVHLATPGLDEFQHLLWSPEHPNLVDVSITLRRGETVLDEVRSYTALRSVEARNGTFYLNGRPYFLRLALDQGYWDESLLAAPSDDALKRDVKLAKVMGFNGVRKHQKIEDPRYLYWADKLGLLVWEEMPSAYAFGVDTLERLTREWTEVLNRDYNHPCIVTWVCFNESWGVPDLPRSSAQRHAVAALYHLTKALDPTRPVVGNDGWEHVVTDLLTIHDYSRKAKTLKKRYGSLEASLATSAQTLEHGRALLLDGVTPAGQPVILSEFGGVRFHPEGEGWGYQQVRSPEALLELYAAMIRALTGLAGFCYTQFADTYQEQNGLLYSDRRPKVGLRALNRATRGKGVRRGDKE